MCQPLLIPHQDVVSSGMTYLLSINCVGNAPSVHFLYFWFLSVFLINLFLAIICFLVWLSCQSSNICFEVKRWIISSWYLRLPRSNWQRYLKPSGPVQFMILQLFRWNLCFFDFFFCPSISQYYFVDHNLYVSIWMYE